MLNFPRLCFFMLAGGFCFLAGCGASPPNSDPANAAAIGDSSYFVPDEIAFLDSVESNALSTGGLEDLAFVDVDGNTVTMKDLLGKKNLVLVITRGHTVPICPYCSTQTSRLISNYDEFTKRNAEVVVVYPVEKQSDAAKLDDFLAATRERLSKPDSTVPFPILLDVELQSVTKLGINKDLSKPATYILDTEGQVRFAFVGATIADRPSIKALLEQLDAIEDATTEGANAEDASEAQE